MGNTVTKAKLIVEGKEKPIQVEFNPSEYNLSSSIQYSEKNIPGLDGPIGQYIAGNSTTLNVTFFLIPIIRPHWTNPKREEQT